MPSSQLYSWTDTAGGSVVPWLWASSTCHLPTNYASLEASRDLLGAS